MAKSRKEKPKQGPPVAFRPGPELEHLVAEFASNRGLGVNDAYKHLAALAVVGLDGGYYDLLARQAARLTGPNAFVRAVVHIHTALAAAARIDPQYAREPARMRLVIRTVLDQLPGADERVLTEVAGALLVRLGVQGGSSPAGDREAEDEEPVQPTADREKVRVVRED
jgi:hypothetical protein